jgi:hypothetical protein
MTNSMELKELKTLNNFLSILTESVVNKMNEAESFDLNEKGFRKFDGQYIKENIIRPIVERHLIEAEMAFVDGEQDDEDEIEEATTTSGVGAFAYDAPAFNVDPKTQKFKKNESMERLHASIKKLVENRLGKKLPISEAKKAGSGRELMDIFKSAVRDPSLFNDPVWVSRFEEIQSNPNSGIKVANSQILKGMRSGEYNIDPDLYNDRGFQNVLSLIKGGKFHNDYADKKNDELENMHNELKANPELANDEKFMERYNDLKRKYGNRRRLDGKPTKMTTGVAGDTILMVSGIVNRVFDYISKIYSNQGLSFNKVYPYVDSHSGNIIKKKPSEEWDSLRLDIYENLGFEYNKDKGTLVRTSNANEGNDIEIQRISMISNDNQFMMELGKKLGEVYTEEDIADAAEFFKDEVENAKEKLDNTNLEKNSSIELNYRY